MTTNSKVATLNAAKQAKSGVKPPNHLKKAGKKLWIDVAETFQLEGHDFVLLTALCETLDRKNEAERDLRKHNSLTFTNRHGELKTHPAVTISRDCNILMARLRRELSLSEEPTESRPSKLKYGGPK